MIRDCSHVADMADPTTMSVENAQRILNKGCETCPNNDNSESWMCLACREVGCSRYVAGHMIQHSDSHPNHKVAISLADLNTWCYLCDGYIVAPETEAVRIPLYVAKFGQIPPQVAEFGDDDEVKAIKEYVATHRVEHPPPRPLTPNRTHFADQVDGQDGDAPLPTLPHLVNFGHKTKGELTEYLDAPDVIDAKVEELADLVLAASSLVVHTGAGISASSGIRTYRAPNGVWTRKAQGLAPLPNKVPMEDAEPTLAHMAIKDLVDAGRVSHVISTNVDGLHLKSGLDPDTLSEVHGNMFVSRCLTCDVDTYHEGSPIRGLEPAPLANPSGHPHAAGIACPTCGNEEIDTIINFGENLHPRIITRAVQEANNSDAALVLGSSVRVSPARDLIKPGLSRLAIVNLQTTPFDDMALVRIFGKTDDVMEKLMAVLRARAH